MKKMIVLSLAGFVISAAVCQAQTAAPKPAAPAMTLTKMDEAKQKDWLARWDKNITGEAKNYRVACDKSVGEDIAWAGTAIWEGFYNGYMATHDTKYIDLWVDWTDSLIKRAVKEPDGYLGWPGKDPHGTEVDNLSRLVGDSMLSEAMVFRSITLMSGEILKTPALKEKYGAKAESYLKLSEQLAEKWMKRNCWRETKDGGMISVVTYYGLNKDGNGWDMDAAGRADANLAFSHPNNKANKVASWMLALWDVTGKPEYKERAEKWFRLLKSRLKLGSDGTYDIWDYWEPAGAWDYKPGTKNTKHWVGVHGNGGYYDADLGGMVDAYEHGLVFTKEDIQHLIDTAKTSWVGTNPGALGAGMLISVAPASGTAKAINACMANSKTAEPASAGAGALGGTIVSNQWDVKGGKGKLVVQPKDPTGAPVTFDTDEKTKVQVLRMWGALAPYDVEIQKSYEATLNPESWGGVSGAPAYLMLQSKLAGK
jgi:hypothetical protein